ncbi:MAG TPA: HAD family hydrolase [Candidatus Onthovicinus excrementipullorum]|nr:HAD family hydrolase [Candidatus Onthovicinus excrementipullorum]
MLKIVIFDLDGTIGDTLPLCVTAFKKAIEPLGGVTLTPREIISHFGPSEEGVIRELFPDRYEEALELFINSYRELHDMAPKPFDGITDLLAFLKSKGIKNTIVTGKGMRTLQITLEKYGIASYFDILEAGSPEGPCKAAKIRKILDELGITAQEALYVGDAPTDITESREVGVEVASAAWASTAEPELLEQMNPGHVFDSVAGLRAYLEQKLA